jgi:primosomal protein N' (replication factor Y) (superfamily II helicase)
MSERKKQLYADIAVPTVPKDTLTYGVPGEMREVLTAGMRVVVPLGRRQLMGFTVNIHDQPPDFAVKSIQQLLDNEAVITDPLMRLCQWMHQYYCCHLGDALKAALPQGMDVDSARHISLRNADDLAILRAVGKSKIKRDILRILGTGEVLSEQDLLDRMAVKSIGSQLRELQFHGIITIESVLELPSAKPRTALFVRLLPEWRGQEKIVELCSILERRAPKQVNLLTMLWQKHERGEAEILMAELLRLAKASSTQVRALEEKGIVEIVENELIRAYLPLFEERPKEFALTGEQQSVLATVLPAIDAGTSSPMLLYGVTASGKTQVYIEAIRHALSLGKSGLVLVPEISLTPQLVARFKQAFGSLVAVMHSRMSLGERYDAWRLTLKGEYRVVVGVRSAVFAPVMDPGIIVVDEEQDSSYKQSDADPRYNARDAAVMRGFFENIPVLLGSATPSVESWHNADIGKYRLLRMTQRIDQARMPDIVPVDMTEARRMRRVRGSLSMQLLDEIRQRMQQGEASIVFQNRRGFAPHLECNDCGHVENCDNCSISLTFHKDGDMLRCHYCGLTRKPPVVCPRCGATEIDRIGSGTQRIEEELQAALPEARILRMDADTTKRKGAHDLMLTAFSDGEYDILLGTQMVAKGLDFDRVTLVGIVSAEQSLFFPDFRASERTVQLLMQVSGRSGRGSAAGRVLIQASVPTHPVFTFVYNNDYDAFLAQETESRRNLSYPPFTRLVALLFSGENEEQVARAARKYYDELRAAPGFFTMHPPQPALLSRLNKRYRYHLLMRVNKRRDSDGNALRTLLQKVAEEYLRSGHSRSVTITIDVDPQNLM